MVGYGDDKGIVPQAMEEMFKRIAANSDKNVKFMVEASMYDARHTHTDTTGGHYALQSAS